MHVHGVARGTAVQCAVCASRADSREQRQPVGAPSTGTYLSSVTCPLLPDPPEDLLVAREEEEWW